MNHIILYIIVLSASLLILSCKQEKKSQLEIEVEKALPEMESKAGQYDPSIAINTEKSHRAVLIKQVQDGSYQIVSISEPRKGVLPYAIEQKVSRNRADFKVIWSDEGGNFIGAYSIEHPLHLRTCEDGESKTQKSDLTQFEILIPTNTAISMLEILENDKQSTRLLLNKNTRK